MLKNKVALVTGGSRGIGAAIAQKLAADGARVAVNYHSNKDAADKVVKAIQDAGGNAKAYQGDATDNDAVRAMVAAVQKDLGPIDVLVNNASIMFPVVPFMDYKWEDFAAKLNGEAKASFFSCQAVLPGMIERGGGSIVNISSELSRTPGPGFVAHASAKSALDAFSKSLALELGSTGVRVNVVAPGLIMTDATRHMPPEMIAAITAHTPLGRVGEPDDVAGVVAFLAGDEARHMTGAYLHVCGGSSMV